MAQIVSYSQKFNILRDITERFPLKCKLFLNLLLSHLPQGHHIQTPKDFKKAYGQFTHIFNNFSTDQKLYFIGQISDYIASYLRNELNGTKSIVHQIETSCEIKTSVMGIGYWEKRTFKYDYQVNRIRFFNSKKEDVIDLRYYLVRKSTSEKCAMVLQAIQKTVSDKLGKITVKFKNSSIFQEIYQNIRKGIVELSQKKMEELLNQQMKERNLIKMPEINRINKGFTILTTKNMTEYFNKKEKLSEKLHKNRVNASMLCNKNNTRVYRSHQNKKCYYLEQNIFKTDRIQAVKQSISLLSSRSLEGKLMMEILEVFNQNITANYYKLDVGIKEYEFLVINQRKQQDGLIQQTMKAATQFFLDISIEFIIATLKKVSESQYSFQLSIILNPQSKKQSVRSDIFNLLFAMGHPNDQPNRKSSFKNIPGLIGSENFSEVQVDQFNKFQQLNPNKSLQEVLQYQQNFTTSSGKKDSSDSIEVEKEEQERFYTIVPQQEEGQLHIYGSLEEKLMSKKNSEKVIQITQPTVTQDIAFAKAKLMTVPLPKSELKILKEHFLFGEWMRSANGGVVCANQEVIKQQKRILKLVFTRMGNNIFKGNSCMNVSLPIQLFKSESTLISISRNFTYAPLLIEPYVDSEALERMKKLAIFDISINTLSLSVRKPFNPIVGETYQGEIAGCPIMLEQISHHPPVTSIYFVGRGYKIYGTMNIDVNLRLNYVKGVNNCNLTLQYDSGDKIHLGLPVMILNGLIFGERTIYWQGIVHIIDYKNLLVTQLTYNSINLKKGLFNFKTQSPDYLTGEIYKVTPSFMQKFIQSSHTLSFKKDQANKIVSKITGQWNGKIMIDEQQVFNFQEQLPVELQNYSCSLPSDSAFRTDAIQLTKGDMNLAQDQKDRLQQLQRKDRKLRQKYKGMK